MESKFLKTWMRWLIVAASALLVACIPVPEGITRQSWVFLATFIGWKISAGGKNQLRVM